jgi:hypothetical protein
MNENFVHIKRQCRAEMGIDLRRNIWAVGGALDGAMAASAPWRMKSPATSKGNRCLFHFANGATPNTNSNGAERG